MFGPGQPIHAEVSPKLSAQGVSLTPNNGSFPRNFRPILPNTPADEQQFRLRWEQHIPNQQAMFAKLLDRGSFCDVALACEEKLLNVHKLVLSACSTYFESILTHFDKRDPVIILKDVKYETMLALVHFMYKGEVCLDQSQLAEVLDAAHALKIKGLSEDINDNGRNHNTSSTNNSFVSKPNENPKVGAHPTEPTFNRAKRARRRGRPKKEIAQIPLVPEVRVADRDETYSPLKKRKRSAGRPRRGLGSTEEVGEADSADEPEAHKRRSLVPLGRPRKESEELSANSPEAVNTSVDAISAHSTPKKNNTDGPVNNDDIVQLDAYIQRGGTYQKYWSEPWVSHVMDAIKRKELSMQDGASYLGMKYASLYGRYRVHHGYLINREIIKQKKSKNDTNDDAGASDADASLPVDESASKTGQGNEWDSSMNLEPIIQIDEEDNAAKVAKESTDTKSTLTRDTEEDSKVASIIQESNDDISKKETDNEIESPSILGLNT